MRRITIGALGGLAGAALAVAGVIACTTSDTGSVVTGAIPNLALAIVSPKDGACVFVEDVPDTVVPISLNLCTRYGQQCTPPLGFEIRPPGACDPGVPCGHYILRVNGVDNNTSATQQIDFLLRKVANHYADFKLTVELVDDNGDPILDQSDTPKPIGSSIDITTVNTPCPMM